MNGAPIEIEYFVDIKLHQKYRCRDCKMVKSSAKGKRLGIIVTVALAALLLVTACAPGLPVEKEKVVKSE
jgi:hypothetical protein